MVVEEVQVAEEQSLQLIQTETAEALSLIAKKAAAAKEEEEEEKETSAAVVEEVKCAETKAQKQATEIVMEAMEEAVNEIEPVSTELTAAS